MVSIDSITPNLNNPRYIKKQKFEALKKSLKDSPEFLSHMKLKVDENGLILGGNMRYRALKELGYTEIPEKWIQRVTDIPGFKKAEFIIKDNLPFGDWDFDILPNLYERTQLIDWGMEVPDYFAQMENDAKRIVEFSAAVNLTIRCENTRQLEGLKKRLGITSNTVAAADFQKILDKQDIS